MVKDRDLKRKIREAYAPPRPQRRDEFLQQVSRQDAEDETRLTVRVSRRDFLLSQLGYIRKRVWVLSVVLFFAAVFLAWIMPNWQQDTQYYVTTDGTLVPVTDDAQTQVTDYEPLLWCMSAVLPLLGVIFFTEESRSFRYGMQEFEMAAKHNLMQVYLARMLFLGLGNLLWIIAADILLHWVGSGAADFVIVYLLVPYLLSMVLSLEISRVCSRSNAGIYSVAAGCGVSAGYIILRGMVDLYREQYRLYWATLCALLLYQGMKRFIRMEKTWEEMLCSLH